MNEHWKVLSSSSVFSAPPYLEVTRQRLETPDGLIVPDFYQVHLRSFALCVPVLTNGAVVVTRQYKHGPGKVTLTFPGGHLEPGEEPAAGCRRELLEETGLTAGRLIELGRFVDNGNQRGCIGHYFIALDCRYVAAPANSDLEDMKVLEMSAAELDGKLADGSIAIMHHAGLWAMARMRSGASAMCIPSSTNDAGIGQ